MKIKVIGCGNAFSDKNFNQSFLIEEGDRKMLIDCGMQTPQALKSAGVDIKDITDIYISHLHADHVGGMENFAFQTYDWANKPTVCNGSGVKLFANDKLMVDMWDKSLRGGLESMEGFVATLDTFFVTQPIKPNQPFLWQGWKVEIVQQIHIMSGSMVMPSFGLIFTQEGHKSVYFVTDSQHCSPQQVQNFYNKADIIFQDCECIGVDFSMKEGEIYYQKGVEIKRKSSLNEDDIVEIAELYTEGWEEKTWNRFKFGSGVHANYAQLAGYPSANSTRLSKETKSKMYLSHYQDFVNPTLDHLGKDFFGHDNDWCKRAEEDGFKGFVEVGMEIDI